MSKATVKHSTGADVRAWAVEQGITEGHGKRGRLSKVLIEQYDAAHTGATYAASTGKAKVSTTEIKVSLTGKGGKPYSKKVQVENSRLRTLAGVTSTQGRLSAASLEVAAKNLSAEMQAAKDQA